MDQRLSAGWSAHWILAIPVFFGVAWYFARRHAVQGVWPVILTVGLGVFLGQVIEPVLEVMAGDSFAEVYEPARVRAFLTFVATGVLTLVVSFTSLRFLARGREAGQAAE